MGWIYNVVMFVRLGKNRKGENQSPMRWLTVDVLGSSQMKDSNGYHDNLSGID